MSAEANIPDGAGRLNVNDAQFRRDMLEWALRGGFATVIASSFTIGAINSDNQAKTAKINQAEFASQEELAHQESLQVRFFAHQIMSTSTRLTMESSTEELTEMVGGFFAASTIGGFILRRNPEVVQRLVGAGTAVLAGGGDLMSTIAFAAPLSDPRMKKYGLDIYIDEINSSLPHQPTPEDVKRFILPSEIERIVLGFLLPSIGRGYLGALPAIMRHNYNTAATINLALLVGDKVAEMIKEGKTKTEIELYLEGINLRKRVRRESGEDSEGASGF